MRFCSDEGGVHGWQYFTVLNVDISNERSLLGFVKLKTFSKLNIEWNFIHRT